MILFSIDLSTAHNNLVICFILALVILFGGTQGKIIKKIKIYTLPDGKKKGDALITFSKAEHAHTACIKVAFTTRSLSPVDL